MSRTHRHLFACVLFGCTAQPSDGAAGQDSLPGDPDAPGSEPGGEVDNQPAEPPAIALTRGLGHETRLTEVWLDPRASAALTLDAIGDVRLWPALPNPSAPIEPGSLAGFEPIRVPVREPLWLSLARAGERSLVVAAIDTAQAARVLAIDLDEAGNASFRERFAIPPRDPLLELHVLDGGERLLALGVDHRIRLYDGRGTLLSELTEYGLAPWQLRVAGPPEAPQLAMVLAGPTRLQRFTITDYHLAKHGEARAFTLDRGPNGNDLALLPSGHVAAVLRRPKAKGPQWSLELHDLDTGEVRVMWGEIKATLRPRLLIVDDQWALLEDGISGYWLDLRQAVVMPGGEAAPFELPEKLEELPPESHVITLPVPLPGTSQHTRRHASVVAGLRVTPDGRTLLLDPVSPSPATGAERHVRLGHRELGIAGLDFDAGGDLLAIAYGDKTVVESLTTGIETPSCDGSAQRVSFIDPDHLLLITATDARICEWRTGKILATIELGLGGRSLDGIAIHPTGPGAGELGLRWHEWVEASSELELRLTHTRYANEQFGPLEPISKADIERWSELDLEGKVFVVDAKGNRYALDDDTRTLSITLASGERRTLAIVEPGDDEVDIERIEPSPDGRFVALVTGPATKAGYEYGYGYGYGYGSDEPETLSIWATASDPPELRWSTITNDAHLDVAWTDDASRLAIDNHGRLRVITSDGAVLLDRASRSLTLEQLPDVQAPPTPADKPPP